MKWLLILSIFYSFFSKAESGPTTKPQVEIFHSFVEKFEKINFSQEVYLQPYGGIDSQWMERFGIPFAMKMGKLLKLENLLINLNLVGFYKIPFGYPLGEYALKAQLTFPLPD